MESQTCSCAAAATQHKTTTFARDVIPNIGGASARGRASNMGFRLEAVNAEKGSGNRFLLACYAAMSKPLPQAALCPMALSLLHPRTVIVENVQLIHLAN